MTDKQRKREIPSEEKPKVVSEEIFCFPNYGVSISAVNRKEAEKKLKELLKK